MRGSRTKDIDKANVIAAKINNPDATLQEIESQTWINYETARKILNEDLPEVVKSSENIKNLFDRNDNLQTLADARIAQLLLAWKEIHIRDLTSLRDSTFKQNAVIWLKKWEWEEKNNIIIQI